MEQRITLVTLGVRDLQKSAAFFERLGWRRSVKDVEGVAFYQCGSIALGLYPWEALAEDAGVAPDGQGFVGITLAHNVRTKDQVDSVLADAEAAGASIVKPAQDVFWGGYHGYFRDLDGHLWEVAWNPGFPLDADGAVTLPD
ncbi:Glyoxalase-like domain protein [Methyloligella halotolerans]|uniref:Glyoxalase-like domain protein n=1 Tax=Methyloligella halotolerans TaxID=1177755 RepID=A0A1E2RWX5_9HYPH|nr:VOC family protein [Methyloligella halotolerans]ODA66766.1 Glyoxalase-like domain protein [Methyloligella halotolerans]